MIALYGEELKNMVRIAENFDKRDCYGEIEKYLYGGQCDKVCLLYGLRRTGKTTLMRQLILNMDDDVFSKTIYVKASQTDSIADVSRELKAYKASGYKYIFIDEVTLIDDFIDAAAIFSDVYAASGMKIVLSGTDSLGFYFAINEELYDRAVTVHTTLIPYREHTRLLNIKSIDEYIRYGGTLKAGEVDFENEEVNLQEASFRDDESTRRYIDTAICRNIQHSLKYYEDGGHFRHLRKLYDANELTNAINRIIQYMNHDFTVDVILRRFKSRDLKSAAQMLRSARDEDKRTDALDNINTDDILSRLKKILEIREKEELTQRISETVAIEIKEYLKALDLIETIAIETTSDASDNPERVIFNQPGMRYCQAEALVYSLMKSNEFKTLSEKDKTLITNKILEDVRGIMLEDIVLLETMKTLPKSKRAFKFQFDAGEFDMVIYDSISNTCEIFEIKHSREKAANQWKNLVNESYITQTEGKYGEITRRCVLYTGTSEITKDGYEYKNVEEYLSEI